MQLCIQQGQFRTINWGPCVILMGPWAIARPRVCGVGYLECHSMLRIPLAAALVSDSEDGHCWGSWDFFGRCPTGSAGFLIVRGDMLTLHDEASEATQLAWTLRCYSEFGLA